MEERVSLRPVTTDDLPIFFVHQLDPEATKLAAFPSRDRDAFFTHWTTNILGNPAALNLAILAGDQVAGNIGALGASGLFDFGGAAPPGAPPAAAATAASACCPVKAPIPKIDARHRAP